MMPAQYIFLMFQGQVQFVIWYEIQESTSGGVTSTHLNPAPDEHDGYDAQAVLVSHREGVPLRPHWHVHVHRSGTNDLKLP